MTMTPLLDQAFYARRARRWAFVSACLATLLVVVALVGHAAPLALAVYCLACGFGWWNVLVQHWALRAALAVRPASDR